MGAPSLPRESAEYQQANKDAQANNLIESLFMWLQNEIDGGIFFKKIFVETVN